jgi:hypothetical protein
VDQAGGKMAKIDFLTVILNRGAIPQVNHLFKRFQKETQIAVEASFVGWDTVWRELVNIGIYHRGADVAEVGTTWLESLVAMNAFRPKLLDAGESLPISRLPGHRFQLGMMTEFGGFQSAVMFGLFSIGKICSKGLGLILTRLLKVFQIFKNHLKS